MSECKNLLAANERLVWIDQISIIKNYGAVLLI